MAVPVDCIAVARRRRTLRTTSACAQRDNVGGNFSVDGILFGFSPRTMILFGRIQYDNLTPLPLFISPTISHLLTYSSIG